MNDVKDLVSRAIEGHAGSVARLISGAERGEIGESEMQRLHAAGSGCYVIGVTGVPGSGKSTLVAALIRHQQARRLNMAVLAVDPTSSYSGGALLGDRIRMSALAGDPPVFIRSMATRGNLGGLALATGDAVTILAASGRDVVIVETVGVGQDEVDIAKASHTTILVSVPGLGDDVQSMKSGVLEIADIHAVNKSDMQGSDKVVAELKEMLRLGGDVEPGHWRPPVVSLSALTDDGVDRLIDAIDGHRAWLQDSGHWGVRESQIAESRIRLALTEMLMKRIQDPAGSAGLREVVDAVRKGHMSPRTAATRLIDSSSMARAFDE